MDERYKADKYCYNCKHNHFDRDAKDYGCDCEASDMYGLNTQYYDTCEEWERDTER